MQTDLDPDHLTQEAVAWFLRTPKSQRPRASIVEIREHFPQLGAQGACQVLRLVNLVRSGGANADG
ncbi:hypothetical protein EN833_23375 [Mesorhizobium sp. M4B.F.Ca.ET.190.01.1.1]|uniref:hypothetical protein n=1 Tax=unclassified Mesorhizobium TaxID=325217 RepID=UPI0010930FD3|nr:MULTISPECIES: hypothetical protein [unclassified Mesorhizobium]TGR05415.1 hypothetical protein EN843_23365 [Mesorhizobium sp. M4B.F.Ca.ET.200.01.1.1]TGS15671.1 hypothetical protein EN833_23375 [Mesorhizobium sp. M4B.F.Ca.ET.190.01.1.1]TGT27731.1 hypothetical protein EN815_23350 [Mesorhizobium sp. M4B.F.Ca.ET.172.01.1.1]